LLIDFWGNLSDLTFSTITIFVDEIDSSWDWVWLEGLVTTNAYSERKNRTIVLGVALSAYSKVDELVLISCGFKISPRYFNTICV
jgi:hypothetical protein